MTRTFPADLNQFIQNELQTGGYADENAVLMAAHEVFREVRDRHAELRRQVQDSLVQLHEGSATVLVWMRSGSR